MNPNVGKTANKQSLAKIDQKRPQANFQKIHLDLITLLFMICFQLHNLFNDIFLGESTEM
jgi:hypothetical protein